MSKLDRKKLHDAIDEALDRINNEALLSNISIPKKHTHDGRDVDGWNSYLGQLDLERLAFELMKPYMIECMNVQGVTHEILECFEERVVELGERIFSENAARRHITNTKT